MLLQKLKHAQIDIVTDDGSSATVVHCVNEISNGGEFTVCGRAIPDSLLEFEGWVAVGQGYKGSLRECECKDCLAIIEYFKKLR